MDGNVLRWKEQSRNAGESMPLSGHDVGCNVWVENGELLLYLAQSGAFDEHGGMLKAGRLRLHFSQDVFGEDFLQELRLGSGDIAVSGRGGSALLWADTGRSAVHLALRFALPTAVRCSYELWRDGDFVQVREGEILFYHRNTASNLLDERLAEQGIEALRPYFPDVERNRTSGGLLSAPGLLPAGESRGRYMDRGFTAWSLETASPVRELSLAVSLHISQAETARQWERELREAAADAALDRHARERTLAWWRAFWERSWVKIKPDCADASDVDWQVGRNYQLFRYMQASNAYGEFPTKFNGGLFTVDAAAFVPGHHGSPDWRDWGGIMFTAQNQRLVYWPMIKNGDFDMMLPAFEFYRRLVPALQKRTEHFFGLADAACFCEQIDANGLSSHYGKYGVDYPLQVRHHYVEALEFCYMILCWHKTSGEDFTPYLDLIRSVLNFYEKRYAKLDERGRRVIFPSTAMETYHGAPLTEIYGKEGVEAANYCDEETAVTNPADVIAALRDAIAALLETNVLDAATAERFQRFKGQLPPIPTEEKHGHRVIAPCEFPKRYFKGNCEIPQLNTVYPYHSFGLGSPDLELARSTYQYGWDEEDQLQHISWHTNGAYAARLGLVDEAVKYMRLKLGDSGRKFPAFWGPGHDYTPDHNWGGSGMINVQEMLLQNVGGRIVLLPAWDRRTDVSFRLWADGRTRVDAELRDGRLTYTVVPAERAADVVVPAELPLDARNE